MTDTFEPDGLAVPYAVEGEGPVSLVLLAADRLDSDGLGVIAHYLAEEAGFQIVRIGSRAGADAAIDERVANALAVADHLGIDHAWVGGHAYGGTVARHLALGHHHRVNGLLLLGVEDARVDLPPDIPVLIIQGADDDVTPPANGELVRASAPERSSVTTLDGAGHLFPATHPVEAAVVIEEYLDWD